MPFGGLSLSDHHLSSSIGSNNDVSVHCGCIALPRL